MIRVTYTVGQAADFAAQVAAGSVQGVGASWALATPLTGNVSNGSNGLGLTFGHFSVYVDDMYNPVLTVPMHIENIYSPYNPGGTAWIAWTAASGQQWETAEVLSWNFTSTDSVL